MFAVRFQWWRAFIHLSDYLIHLPNRQIFDINQAYPSYRRQLVSTNLLLELDVFEASPPLVRFFQELIQVVQPYLQIIEQFSRKPIVFQLEVAVHLSDLDVWRTNFEVDLVRGLHNHLRLEEVFELDLNNARTVEKYTAALATEVLVHKRHINLFFFLRLRVKVAIKGSATNESRGCGLRFEI